jgi:hypothetical protein
LISRGLTGDPGEVAAEVSTLRRSLDTLHFVG